MQSIIDNKIKLKNYTIIYMKNLKMEKNYGGLGQNPLDEGLQSMRPSPLSWGKQALNLPKLSLYLTNVQDDEMLWKNQQSSPLQVFSSPS